MKCILTGSKSLKQDKGQLMPVEWQYDGKTLVEDILWCTEVERFVITDV